MHSEDIGAHSAVGRVVLVTPEAKAHDDKKYPGFWRPVESASCNRHRFRHEQRSDSVRCRPDTRYYLKWLSVCQDQNLGGRATDPTFT